MNIEEHETLISKSFILHRQRDRFIEISKSRTKNHKRRRKYNEMMANLEHWIDPRCTKHTLSTFNEHSEVLSELKNLGVDDSGYVMSHDEKLDGNITKLEEIFKYFEEKSVYGTLVSFGHSGVAYYEQSELDDLTMILLAINRSKI